MQATLGSKQVNVYGHNVIISPVAGAIVRPDEWAMSSRLATGFEDDGPATWRLPSGRYDGVAYPVEIEVTGRTFQYPDGASHSPWIRVKFTFLHDGDEPATTSGGWMKIDERIKTYLD